MNPPDTQVVQHLGRTYIYDSERDIFYCAAPDDSWDTWAWLAVLAVLAAIGLWLEFWPIR